MSELPFLSLVPPTTLDVACADQTHRLRWEAGELISLDHEDPEGERTLAALGGADNGCLEVLDAWNRRCRELRVLTLASRGPTDALTFDRPNQGGGSGLGVRGASSRPVLRARPASRRVVFGTSVSSGWSSYSSTSHAVVGGSQRGPQTPEPADDYSMLFALSGGLGDRLAATVAAHWANRVEHGEVAGSDEPALQAALTGRAWVAVCAWLGDPSVDVKVQMTGADQLPVAIRREHGWLLELPFRWLSRVWAPSLAVTAGRLVLDARRDGDALTLTTVKPGDDTVTPMTLEI
jgi:hypothetical protein